jgi:hypothetical protein
VQRKGEKGWQLLRVLLRSVKSVAKSLKYLNVEVKQNTVQRNVQMYTGQTQERLKGLSCIVSDAGKSFMIIPVIGTDGSIARMNARTAPMSSLKGASVHIAKRCLKSIRQVQTFVVRWSAEMLGQKRQTGRHLKSYCGNVSNVARNFGGKSHRLKDAAEITAQRSVRSILKNLMLLLRRGFTDQVFGYRFVKGYFFGTASSASNAVWTVKGFMFTIKSLRETVVERVTTTSSRFALIVTGFYTLADNVEKVLVERVCSLLGDSPFVVFVVLG